MKDRQQTDITDEEAAERRWAAHDEWMADQDFDRRKREHDNQDCDSDHCEFCLAELDEKASDR